MTRILSFCLSFLILTKTFAQPSLSPKTFRDCPDCPLMTIIPSGVFLMGCSPTDSVCTAEESPRHKVQIKKFAAGTFDVTLKEWESFANATHRTPAGGCAWTLLPPDSGAKPWDLNPHATWRNLGFEQSPNHPVVCISWQDVQDYMEWLSKKTGKKYRLLTEAEWEYAARAGSTTPFPWPSGLTHDAANYGSDTCCHAAAAGKDQWLYTSPCDAFPPNAFGLYDMYGNVLQYVEDYLSPNYTNTPTDGSPYLTDTTLTMTGRFAKMTGLKSRSFRIVRGGDWGDTPGMLRASARNWSPGPRATLENYRSAGLGFRVARSMN
ncbi:MAG: formylglycine-generating enzyme family protein [Bacteroidetes bacterium]|nr:formylglycine-generating enzyme family protein [Bacteroidota bacterium]